jgi:hypothetical protein
MIQVDKLSPNVNYSNIEDLEKQIVVNVFSVQGYLIEMENERVLWWVKV